MNIVLVEPQIPQNTGNIARLCAATGTPLHLVGKLGFRTDDRYLKRAGLDYWKFLDVTYYETFAEFEIVCRRNASFYLLTTKAVKIYTEATYENNDYLIFGSETKGLDVSIRKKYAENCLRIPMIEDARSLNLSTAAGIVLFEAMRQNSFVNCRPSP